MKKTVKKSFVSKQHPAYSVKGGYTPKGLRAAYNLGGRHAAEALPLCFSDDIGYMDSLSEAKHFSPATRQYIGKVYVSNAKRHDERIDELCTVADDRIDHYRRELSELRANISEQVPEVEKLQARIADLEKAVAFRDKAIAGMDVELEDARDEIADLRRYKNPLFSIVAAIRKDVK